MSLPQPDDLSARRASQGYQWTLEQNWDGDDWVGPGLPPWGTRNRCPAVRHGKRCRKACIPGGTVCDTHGGAAPQVKRRAKLRALQLLDPALGQLARTLANPADQRIGLAAVKMVLDINGVSGHSDVDATLAKQILMDRHYALQAAANKAIQDAEDDGLVLDAEIIEDEDHAAETGGDRAPSPPSQVVPVDGDTRTQQEIDDDDELLYDPAASRDFELAEAAEFRAAALAELNAPAPDEAAELDDDPRDPGPDDVPIVTFHHDSKEPSGQTG